RAGRWVQGTGKMQQYYLSNLPVRFARGIAGFRSKSSHLRRNELVPPETLQQSIFPFIEDAYRDHGDEAHQRWLQECKEEMDEVNQNDFEADDEEEDTQEVVIISSRKSKTTIENERTSESGGDIAKKRFLKLLIRLRRVILQDAVALIRLGWTSPVLQNKIFTESPEFTTFDKQLRKSLERKGSTTPDNLPPNIVEAIQASSSQYNTMYTTMDQRIGWLDKSVNEIKAILLSRPSQQQPSYFVPPFQAPQLFPTPLPVSPMAPNGYQYYHGPQTTHTSSRANPGPETGASFSIQIQASQSSFTRELVVRLWKDYKGYLNFRKSNSTKRQSVDEKILKRISSTKKVLLWFILQAQRLYEEEEE
ncbi:hypothetical protein BGX27_003905, partial [Mortierella sp. AM989]